MAENNALAVQAQVTDIEPRVFSAVEMQQQVQAIQQVMKAVMKSGSHYGTVPGCGDKPTLLKPGAEKIMMTFRIGIDPEVEDMSNPDCIRYRVRARMFSILDGRTLGFGVGECSSEETKYKWRSAFNDVEFEATDPDRRRIKQSKYGATKQVRAEISDVANTILKMAKKRAQVDGVLTVTAASDIFTQDLEDIPAELLNQKTSGEKPEVKQPQAKTPAAKPATPATAAPAAQDATPAQGQTAQPVVTFDPFRGKLKKETVAQILEMAHEMKWTPAKEKAKFEMYDGIGDEAALDSCQAEYRAYINGLK